MSDSVQPRRRSSAIRLRIAGGVAEFLGVGAAGVVRAGQADALRARDRTDVVEMVGDVADGRPGLLGGQRHQAQALGRAQLGERLVGEVGGVGAQGAGRGAGAQDRRLGDRDGAADGGRGGAREVGQHAEPVHLADHLLAEPGQPRLARPGRTGEGEHAQAQGVQHAQDADRVVERGCGGGPEDDGDPSAVAGVGDLPGGARETQPLGMAPGHRPDQVELFQGGADGPVTGEALRQMQRPEQRADVAAPHPGHIGVDGALAELQVVPGAGAAAPRAARCSRRRRGARRGWRARGREGVASGSDRGDRSSAVRGRRRGARRAPAGLRAVGPAVEFPDLGCGVQFVLQIGHGGLRTS